MTNPYVRPDVQAFLTYLASAPGPKMHEMTPADARMAFRMLCQVGDPPVGDLAVVRDMTIPGPAGPIPARLYDPRERREPGPLLVFFHGGGFVVGDLDSHGPFCAEAARTLDMPVVAIDYRLAPEHPFPAATDDCEAAARWIAGNPDALGVKASSLVLAGDSAGGNLTVVVAQALRDAPAAVPVIVQWPIYPAVDSDARYESFRTFADGYLLTADSMRWFTQAYAAPGEDVRNAPIRADHAGMPATLIVTAGLDPLRDQGRAYAAALIQAGVPTVYREATGNIHGFINLRRAIPSGQGDVAGCLRVLKDMIVEAEATRVMAQAAA